MSDINELKNSLSNNKASNNRLPNQLCFISDIQPLIQLSADSKNIQTIGYLIELGSNKSANQHLAKARNQLSLLCQDSIWSKPFINPDYTATVSDPKPDYTNQCGLLMIVPGYQDVERFIKITKDIERQIADSFLISKRKSLNNISIKTQIFNRQVLIDIDVLAVVTTDGVIALAERYPFKSHEWVGLNELHSKGCFN